MDYATDRISAYLEKIDQWIETHEKSKALRVQITELIDDLTPIVHQIEHETIKTTKGNYGRYLTIFSRCQDKGLMLYVLLKSGANEYGCLSAYEIATGKGLSQA